MYPPKLEITTKLGSNLDAAASRDMPARRARSRSPLRGPRQLSGQAHRLRSASTASSSSLSIVSQSTSSTSASTSTLQTSSQSTCDTQRTHSRSSSTSSLDIDTAVQIKSDCVVAMHDYTPQQQNATCLSFLAGQKIHVLNRDPSGWWDGELEGRRGWFPSNYVTSDLESLAVEELPSQNVSFLKM